MGYSLLHGENAQVLEETGIRPLLRILAGPKGQRFSLAQLKAVLITFLLEHKGTLLFSPLQAALSSQLANVIKCHLSLTPVTPKQLK